MPKASRPEDNGKRVACVGAGPASLTVARDLAAIGYEVVVFDSDSRAGGMMRSQIPKFRLPDEVIDEEVGYALSTGGDLRRRPPHRQPQGAARRGLRRHLRRLRRAARARPRHSRPARSAAQHPHRHRMARERVLRPYPHDRQARRGARRRQHRDGLLPHRAAARRRGRQGRGALRLRRDEGLALGEGGRRPRGRRDLELARAQGLLPRIRRAHRRDVREGPAPRRTNWSAWCRRSPTWSLQVDPPGERRAGRGRQAAGRPFPGSSPGSPA